MNALKEAYFTVAEWLEAPIVLACAIVVGSIVAAYMAEFVIRKTVGALAARTATTLDDILVASLRRPVIVSLVLIGWAWAADVLFDGRVLNAINSGLETVVVVVWALAGFRVGSALLQSMTRGGGLIQPSTLPAFELLVKMLVVGAAIYFMFLAWQIDVTAWLASAGIIGVALGFAAKDSLANLFAGLFMMADAPYRVGDWIVIEGDLRGKVSRIGMRSTRILTVDDVEITLPNTLIANGRIMNEAGGPSTKQRITVSTRVAYGTDVDEIEEVLLACPKEVEGVCDTPEPIVRFRAMGESCLEWALLVWIDDSSGKDRIIHELNKTVYKAFHARGIQVPFPQQEVYIRAMPDGS